METVSEYNQLNCNGCPPNMNKQCLLEFGRTGQPPCAMVAQNSTSIPTIVEVINYCSDDNEGVSLGKYDISLINKVYNFIRRN